MHKMSLRVGRAGLGRTLRYASRARPTIAAALIVLSGCGLGGGAGRNAVVVPAGSAPQGAGGTPAKSANQQGVTTGPQGPGTTAIPPIGGAVIPSTQPAGTVPTASPTASAQPQPAQGGTTPATQSPQGQTPGQPGSDNGQVPNLGLAQRFLPAVPPSLSAVCGRAAMRPSREFPSQPTIDGTAAGETINGTDRQDVIRGLDGADTINAGAGDDFVNGNQANDTLNGGDGNDLLLGGSEDDVINGENGNDALFGGLGNDTIQGQAGNDYAAGDDGADTISGGDGMDFLEGLTGDDLLNGNAGDDLVMGGQGNDRVHGGSGQDCVQGNEDQDILFGGQGSDLVDGGDGDDILQPGGPNCARILANPGQKSEHFAWCQSQQSAGALNEGRCTDPTFATCSQDWLLGGAGSDTYVVADGDGRVVIPRDADGQNGLICETDRPVTVSSEGADRIFQGEGFLIRLEGANDRTTSVNVFGCEPAPR